MSLEGRLLMKKLFLIFLILVLLSSCYSTSNDSYSIKNPSNNVSVSQDDKFWKINNFIDAFQEKTDERYLTNIKFMRGTFSNNITKNGKLTAAFIVTESTVSIKLYENEKYVVTGRVLFPPKYTIEIVCENENYQFTAINMDDRLSFLKYDEIIDILKKEKVMDIAITRDSLIDYRDSYIIKNIIPIGFNNLYKRLVS
jgi:hypothetical protein